MNGSLDKRTERELDFYRDVEKVHDLPKISHFWSKNFLVPKLEVCGFPHPQHFFEDYLIRASRSSDKMVAVSLGAGNCDFEVNLAHKLCEEGFRGFRLHCLDLNPDMLERGKALAEEAGVSAHLDFECKRAESWQPDKKVDIVIANQSLHHFSELEVIFYRVKSNLKRSGRFLVHDMIGRNGHLLWPEARTYVETIWENLPLRYKFNHQLRRWEPKFVNWDCSQESYEGIRAQDILPLLGDSFHFEVFVGFANVIDKFIDRSFGPNYDVTRMFDLKLIEAIALLDDVLLNRGEIKPTHMIAALKIEDAEPTVCYRHWTPEFCLRRPDTHPRQSPEVDLQAVAGVLGHLAVGDNPRKEPDQRYAQQIWDSKPWRFYMWLERLKQRFLARGKDAS